MIAYFGEWYMIADTLSLTIIIMLEDTIVVTDNKVD